MEQLSDFVRTCNCGNAMEPNGKVYDGIPKVSFKCPVCEKIVIIPLGYL